MIRFTGAVIIAVFITTYVAAQFNAGAKSLSTALNIPILPALAASGLLVLVYMVLGGYIAVVYNKTVTTFLANEGYTQQNWNNKIPNAKANIRNALNEIKAILINTSSSQKIRLGDVSTIQIVERPAQVNRERGTSKILQGGCRQRAYARRYRRDTVVWKPDKSSPAPAFSCFRGRFRPGGAFPQCLSF